MSGNKDKKLKKRYNEVVHYVRHDFLRAALCVATIDASPVLSAASSNGFHDAHKEVAPVGKILFPPSPPPFFLLRSLLRVTFKKKSQTTPAPYAK